MALRKVAASGSADPSELLLAIAHLCAPDGRGGVTQQSRRMVELLADGLRYGAASPDR